MGHETRGFYGVSIAFAKFREDVSAYYEVYVDWARRRFLRIMAEEELQEEFSAANQNRRLLLAHYNGEVVTGWCFASFPVEWRSTRPPVLS